MRTKTNDALELSLEAAQEVGVAAKRSDSASQFNDAENADKAAVFKRASRALRGAILLHSTEKLGKLVGFVLSMIGFGNSKRHKSQFEIEDTKVLHSAPNF
jgi:hypothetical protein